MPCSQSFAIAPKAAVACGLLYFMGFPLTLVAWRRSRRLAEFLVPVALFQDLFQPRQERRRIGAVEGAVIEALADHAKHARRDEIALRRRDHGRFQTDRVG